MTQSARRRFAALVLALLGTAGGAMAQGSAPNQGVTTPAPPPVSSTPPAPAPGELSNGTPRTDPGGSPTRSDPGTTAGVPIPSGVNTPGPEAGPPAR